jgi:hypothetical protein
MADLLQRWENAEGYDPRRERTPHFDELDSRVQLASPPLAIRAIH